MSRYVIICGGRHHPTFTTQHTDWLVHLHRDDAFAEVITGGAEGAALAGSVWAKTQGIDRVVFLPNGEAYGQSAGPRRNTRMLNYALAQAAGQDGVSVLVCAFAGGKGTLDMCLQAAHRGVKVYTFGWELVAGVIGGEKP